MPIHVNMENIQNMQSTTLFYFLKWQVMDDGQYCYKTQFVSKCYTGFNSSHFLITLSIVKILSHNVAVNVKAEINN